jgi:polysaccharide biosynthesis transport protein
MASNASSTATLGDYFDVLRRRWPYLALVIPAVILAAVYLAYSQPPLYRASATIMLEPSSIPSDMIRTTVTSYADQQIELLRRRVMTTDALQTVIENQDPYPHRTDLNARQKARLIAENTAIERVDPVTLEKLNQSNAFSIHYHNPDPRVAAEVAQRLADLFLDHNRLTRTETASSAYEFLRAQSSEIGARIQVIEQQIADFKSEHGDALPDAQNRQVGALDRAERDLSAVEGQIRVAEERRATLRLQLDQTAPNLFDTSQDWRLELAELRAQLAEARRRYTPDHPDVRRLQRAIEGLQARVDAEGGVAASTVPPDNPEYLRIETQLNTVERELAALRANAEQARRQIRQYSQLRQVAPDVERQYLQLSRDYDTLQRQFADIQAKLSTASLAETLETEQRGERYTQIRSPSTPSRPFSPNRIGIILLGIVLGGGLAVSLAALAEASDPTIRSPRDLREAADIQPIGTVPVMMNYSDHARRWGTWGAITAVFVIATIFVGSVVLEDAARTEQANVEQSAMDGRG